MSLITKDYFFAVCEHMFNQVENQEHLVVELTAEDSHFIRLNGSKIRQSGDVTNAQLSFRYILETGAERRQIQFATSLSGDQEKDLSNCSALLLKARNSCPDLPADPFLELPKNNGTSENISRGQLPSKEELSEQMFPQIQSLDLAGIYASGPVVRANANSKGQRHWFQTDSFYLDYSIYHGEKAVKGLFAEKSWNADAFTKELQDAKAMLETLKRPVKKIAPGSYRTYLAPAAVWELMGMFNWYTVSEAAIRQGNSPLQQLRNGKKSFSPLFNLREDFSFGDVAQFNNLGEVSPKSLDIIQSGTLANALTSSRTAKEYGLESNFANESESLRSMVVSAGELNNKDVLAKLGTGLYLSNLHYLNWSDQQMGRVTGMTRFACFWVENGELVAPIEDLRFDDSLFNLFGSELEALGDQLQVMPATDTYEFRSVSTGRVPSALLKAMEFTL